MPQLIAKKATSRVSRVRLRRRRQAAGTRVPLRHGYPPTAAVLASSCTLPAASCCCCCAASCSPDAAACLPQTAGGPSCSSTVGHIGRQHVQELASAQALSSSRQGRRLLARPPAGARRSAQAVLPVSGHGPVRAWHSVPVLTRSWRGDSRCSARGCPSGGTVRGGSDCCSSRRCLCAPVLSVAS